MNSISTGASLVQHLYDTLSTSNSNSVSTETSQGGFGSVLKDAIDQVDKLSSGADQKIGSMLQGGGGDVSNVMVAVEKADVAFQLMMQVRNKIVNAYQDIEKMQF